MILEKRKENIFVIDLLKVERIEKFLDFLLTQAIGKKCRKYWILPTWPVINGDLEAEYFNRFLNEVRRRGYDTLMVINNKAGG